MALPAPSQPWPPSSARTTRPRPTAGARPSPSSSVDSSRDKSVGGGERSQVRGRGHRSRAEVKGHEHGYCLVRAGVMRGEERGIHWTGPIGKGEAKGSQNSISV